jgi:hypothetical protein
MSTGSHPSTPPRRPGSIRRTTSHTSTRTEGFEGPVTVLALGRDIRTDLDGEVEVLDAARVELEGAFRTGLITRLTSDPAHPGLAAMAGVSAYAGVRRALPAAMPGERESRSVRFQLLDDISTALLLSGRTLRAAGIPMSLGKSKPLLMVDACAGWIDGGTAVTGHTELGPPLETGPVAAPVERDDDPLAWHDPGPLPPHTTRRRRRLDVWREGEIAHVDAFFRDSHADGDGVETVVHQYRVRGTFDPETLAFVDCEAEPGPLPFPECPSAAASAARLGGESVEGLRRWVLTSMAGTSTCTHLNDTLRSFEDVGALLAR